MKLRSMVKTPFRDISHKNASIIRKQKSAGRQVRVVGESQDPSKKLLVTPGIKKSKISTRGTHSKKTSTQSGKVSKMKHSAAVRIPELKRAGRGKKSQSRNTKLAAANVLLTDLDSIVSPTVIIHNRYKVMKDAQKSVTQKPVILSSAKLTSRKSLNTSGEVSRKEFSLINEIDFSRIGKKPAITKLPVSQTKKIQSVVTKQPTLYSNIVSVNSTSSFTSTVFRKESFQETQSQVKSSDSTKTSVASLRFERTEKKEQNDSKIPKQIQSVSQSMNYIAPTKYISFCKASRQNKTLVSNKIAANKSPGFKTSSVGKDNITENIISQSRTFKARNQTRYVLHNKQTRNKPEKRKANRKSQVKKVGATKHFGRKKTQPLARKHKEAVSVVRNSRTLRGSSKKPTQSSKTRIPHTSSVAKKSKSRSDADEKKTAVVDISEVPVYIPKRLQKMAKGTRPVNKLSSLLTLKSLQTGSKEQFAGLTKTTAKQSVVRKQRKLTSEDHLPQNKSLRALKQYAPLLAIEVTPIQSLARRSLKSAISSPIIVSSLCKAAKQTTSLQSKKNEDLNEREIMLPSENVSRQYYSSKLTSTPILSYSSYRIEKASPTPTRTNVTSQLRKKSATKQTKKNTVSAKMKTLFLKEKTVTGFSISDNKDQLAQRKAKDNTHAAYSKNCVSMEYVFSPKQSAKKKNNSFISSVMNQASKSHYHTVEKNFHKSASEVKVKKLPLPVLAKTVGSKLEKMHKRSQSINMPHRKNLRSSHRLNKDMKLTPTHKKKPVSYAVKRTQKQYQSKQKIKPKSKSYLHRTSNKPLLSPKNIPSPAAKVTSSQKSHKPLGSSPQTENQNELLQRKRSLKIKSSLSSSMKQKKASLSDRSTSARSVAEPESQLTNVTDIVFPSSIRKRVSAIGKKTSRRFKESKKRKPVTHSRNIKGLTYINIEDNLELIKNVLPQSKLSKKSVSSVLKRHLKDVSREEKSLFSLRKKRPSLQGKVKKPALRRAGRREFLPEISVKTIAKNKKENKTHGTYSVGKKPAANYRVSNKHSDKNAKLGVKLKGRKPSSPTKQITGRARIVKDAKINLSYPQQTKALKAASRQKVTEISHTLQKLQNLPKANKLNKLTQSKTLSLKKVSNLSTKGDKRQSPKRITTSFTADVQRNSMVTPRETESSKPITLINKVQQTILTQSKTLPTKKSGKLSTKTDKRKSLTGKTTSLVKSTKVQASTMVIPRQTETLKPKTLIKKVQQTIFSPSQKKIITQNKEKVTKAVRGKMFISEISPKLSSKGGIKKSVSLSTRKRLSLGRVAKAELMNFLTPGQNKALQRIPRKTPSQEARYVVSSQSLTAAKISVSKKHLDLPKIIESRKPSVQSKKQTRSAKTTESENIHLVSQGQKKSSTSPKKMGKKKLNKVANNVLLNKVNSKLSKRAKATKLIVPSAKMTRLGKVKEIERIGLVAVGQKKTLEAPSHGGCKIAVTKSSTLTKKKGKKALNKNKNSGKKLPRRICLNTVKRRTAMLSLPKVKVDVSTRASLGIMPDVLANTRGVKSTEGTSNVSFQRLESVYTLNKSRRKTQPSRKISTVLPFNLVSEYASSEISPSQLKRTTDIIYNIQLQNISSPARKTVQASPGIPQHVYEGLGRRSLLLSDTSLEWKMAVPLDTEIAGSGYRRKDKISLLPEKARAESHVCNVSYTRNDREDLLPVSRTTKSPQTLSKNVTYSEQSRKVSTLKVSFSSPIDNGDGHRRYIASTPFPVQGKSAVSSMHFDSVRNSDSDVETISGSQPLLSYTHNVKRNLRLTNPVTSHMVSERENDEESVEDSYTEDGYRIETEEKEKLYINREEEENEELEDNTHVSDVYAEEIGKDDSKTLSPNSRAKQCIIS